MYTFSAIDYRWIVCIIFAISFQLFLFARPRTFCQFSSSPFFALLMLCLRPTFFCLRKNEVLAKTCEDLISE